MLVNDQHLVNFDAESFVKAIQSDFRVSVTFVENTTHGFASQVFKAVLDGRVVFIRINKNPRIFPAELLGYTLFKEHGIPVPDVVAYQAHPATIGHPTMIMYGAEGVELRKSELSLEEKNIVYEKMGALMKRMHEIHVDGYGPVEAKEGKLAGRFSSWKENWTARESYFREEFEYLRANALLTQEEIQKLSDVHIEISTLEFGKASLLHGDFHGVHVFVEGTVITGVIDLGRLLAGDPRYDIAMSLVFQNPRHRERFKKGYGNLANDPAVVKYLLVIAAGKIAIRHARGLHEATENARVIFRETLALIF